MAETVTITMTRDHAEVVQDACEMLMKLGQTMMPTELMLGWPHIKVDEYLLRKYIANGGDRNGWSVAAKPPLSESGHDMPKCEVTNDD